MIPGTHRTWSTAADRNFRRSIETQMPDKRKFQQSRNTRREGTKHIQRVRSFPGRRDDIQRKQKIGDRADCKDWNRQSHVTACCHARQSLFIAGLQVADRQRKPGDDEEEADGKCAVHKKDSGPEKPIGHEVVRRQAVDENMMEQNDDCGPSSQAVEESKSHRTLISRHSKAENVVRRRYQAGTHRWPNESLPSPP